MPFKQTIIASVVSVLLIHTGAAQEWGRFRGPNGEGHASAANLPVQWTEADYRWTADLSGVGYSSPVVCRGKLFVTSAIEDDATQMICCLSATDGAKLWEKSFESKPHKHHPFNCHAASTPALDEEAVYALWANPDQLAVVKLDQATGDLQWQRDLGPYAAEHAFGASPMVYKDMLIIPNDQDGDSSIVALSRETGDTVWQAKRRSKKTAYATPCIFTPKSGPPQLIITSWAHGFSGLDPETGNSLWEVPLFKNRVVGSPLVTSGLVFGSAGTGGIGRQMYAVRPGDPSRGLEAEVVYELKGSLPYVVTPIACGGLLFSWFDKGVVTCLETATGEVLWRERIGGEYFGSPVCVNGRLYCISREGEVVVLAASREFKELGRVALGEASHSTPAVADGVMYLRTKSHVMALGGK